MGHLVGAIHSQIGLRVVRRVGGEQLTLWMKDMKRIHFIFINETIQNKKIAIIRTNLS